MRCSAHCPFVRYQDRISGKLSQRTVNVTLAFGRAVSAVYIRHGRVVRDENGKRFRQVWKNSCFYTDLLQAMSTVMIEAMPVEQCSVDVCRRTEAAVVTATLWSHFADVPFRRLVHFAGTRPVYWSEICRMRCAAACVILASMVRVAKQKLPLLYGRRALEYLIKCKTRENYRALPPPAEKAKRTVSHIVRTALQTFEHMMYSTGDRHFKRVILTVRKIPEVICQEEDGPT